MAKLIGNQGGSTSYPSTSYPSTQDRDCVDGGFTSNFPKDRVTHSHMTPKGEDDQEGQRQYRAKGREGFAAGALLDRLIPRQGPYGDNADRFGAIGNGVDGDTKRGGQWGKDGKSYLSTRPERESFSDDADDSYNRRYGGSGLGKSG